VPGAKVLQVRSTQGSVDASFVERLAMQVAAGEMTQDAAAIALKLVSSGAEQGDAEAGEELGEVAEPASAELDVDIDAALAIVE
jgi:hypothetical protein